MPGSFRREKLRQFTNTIIVYTMLKVLVDVQSIHKRRLLSPL